MTRMAGAILGSGAFVSAWLLASACVVPTISSGSDDGGTSGAASGAESDGGTAGSSTIVRGASCTEVTASISLCEYISACPSFVLPAQFRTCGFRIHGSAIDPECLCDDQYLCPIGQPITCAEAAADSSGDVSYDSVCEQEVTGGCTDLGAPSTAPSSACQACENACDNVPSCIDACGC